MGKRKDTKELEAENGRALKWYQALFKKRTY
ncbi:MAG: hypothetical protein K0S61_2768, partial [Anaerocolumna sp.]|nr:hypothetical protein [Anaerocolumna sp.]